MTAQTQTHTRIPTSRSMSSSSKVIILTGASRGIGLAVAHFLLKQSHKLVVVARSAGPLEELKREYPGQVESVAADLADFTAAEKITATALKSFSRIDGLILNHGILSAVQRLADANLAEWREVYDINVLSCVALIKAAIPALRASKGRVLLTSSGAATGAYTTWGAYGSSKAALNHLASTLHTEEPLITAISIRPGVVDTNMQTSIREVHHNVMDSKDREKFAGLHASGKLLRPEQPGNVIGRLVVGEGVERDVLGGKFLSWDDGALKAFQD